MAEHNHEQLRRLFDLAIAAPADERDALLDRECAADAGLKQRVQAMVAAAEGDSFLGAPTSDASVPMVDEGAPPKSAATLPASPHEKVGQQIDRYKLLQLIGEGGYGAVYMAEQKEPLRRKVALKIIKLGMDTKQVIARFEAERQALAMMDHPNIAKVLDAGATETGRPYFVMELVKGVPVTEYCDTENLTTEERLELFMGVCNAVQHAHQKGIIHRDLKPSNVMITLHDGRPVPKVIDFGIAKATNRELTDKTLFTEYRQFVGTPEYMSPEQAEMSGLDIDTRSDIYSLGVLLYELLTGVTPFDGKRLRSAAINEVQRIIREEEPPKPSTRLSSLSGALGTVEGGDEEAPDSSIDDVAKHRRTDPGSLTKQLRGDLDWIVMKALEKDRTRRYDSATAFADDIGRHLGDEAVLASPPSSVYRLRKFVRRNRASVTVAGVVVVVLLGGVAGTTWGLLREQAARRAESQQRQIAERKTIEAQDNLKLAQKQKQRAQEAQAEAQTQRDAALRQSYVASIGAAQASIEAGEIKTARVRLEQAPNDFRGWEWKSLHAQLDQSVAVLCGHGASVQSVAFSPDGSRIASAAQDGTVRLWDGESGEQLLVLGGLEDEGGFGADGLFHKGQFNSVAFSPDGSRIAAAAPNKRAVLLWDAASGEELAVLRGHESEVWSVAFSPDGSRIASGSFDKTVRLWDASSGDQLAVLSGHESGVKSVAFSPDGSRIASGSSDKTVRLWDASSGQELRVLRGHEDLVFSVAFSPEGSRVASGSNDRTVRLWDASIGHELAVLRGHEVGVTSVAFSPDGSRIASGSVDKTVRLWDTASGEELVVLLGHESYVISVAFSPDGSRIASGSSDKTVRLWDAARGESLLVLRGHKGQVYSAAFSPDGSRIASGSLDRTVRLWDATSGQELAVLSGHETNVSSVAFSPDGSRIVSGSLDHTVRLWDGDSGEQLLVLRGHERPVTSVAFSPDGSLIASGSENLNRFRSKDNTVRLWDSDSGEQLLVLRGHERPVTSVAFSPDGSRIASGDMDHTVRLWDTVSGEELHVLRGHENWVTSVAFSPDGSRIASASWDKTVRLWDTGNGQQLVVLRGESSVWSVAFSPDGSRIASGLSDNTVRLWDASSGQELRVLRGHESSVISVAFSPEGSRIVSASWDKTVRLWDTIAYRDRIAERDQARRDSETIRSLVEELFRKGLDCSAVAERVKTNETLSDPLRHAAANLVLKRCSAIHEQANSLIDDLEERLIFAADIQAGVQAAVQSDPSLDPAVRAAAIRIAALMEDNPSRLSDVAWRIVNDDNRSPADYERAQKAMEVWREHVDQLRAATPADDWRLAEAAVELIKFGMALLKNDQAKGAEPVLRECLSIREEVLEKGNWLIANARSNLGECLAKQGRLTEAEPLLIESANALLGNDQAREDRNTEAIQRVVDLYETWHAAEPDKGYDAKAARWRAKLPKSQRAE